MTDGDGAGAEEFDTPLQADMRSLLNFSGPKPVADLHLKTAMIDILVDELGEESIVALRARPAGEALAVDRYQLADVLACERYYLENRDVPFSFTPATARGRVAGVVLRRWCYRDPRPQESQDWDPVGLVYEALEEIAQDSDRLGEFVSGLSPGGRADLAAAVTNVVLAFEETWPTDVLPKLVRANTVLRTSLLQGRLVLTCRVPFRFGRPERAGNTVLAGVTLFDLRPGRTYEEEERFNRWYAALLELFQVNVAPRRVITWYGESQTGSGEDVDVALLEAAARRVGGAVRRILEVASGSRDPGVSPGWRCQRCEALDTCTEGSVWLRSR